MARKDGGPRDVIVVLGAAVQEGGRPSAALSRRVARAVELFREGKADALLMSGGVGTHPPAEAEVMRDLALRAGVPADRVFVESGSRTTFDNARMTAEIMTRNGWTTAFLVSDAFHLPRSYLAFRSAGVRVRVHAASRPWHGPYPRWWQFLAYEACAIPWYVFQILVGRSRRQR